MPQIPGRAAVNKRIENTVLDMERTYVRSIDKRPAFPRADGEGIFAIYPSATQISVTPQLLSLVWPATIQDPAGTLGETWFALDLSIPDGRPVSLGKFFTSDGLRHLPSEAIATARADSACVRHSFANHQSGKLFLRYAETVSNYDDFAWTSTGLLLGFADNDIAFPTCGQVKIVVPYGSLTGLSTLGLSTETYAKRH